jgi:hypothetical protein
MKTNIDEMAEKIVSNLTEGKEVNPNHWKDDGKDRFNQLTKGDKTKLYKNTDDIKDANKKLFDQVGDITEINEEEEKKDKCGGRCIKKVGDKWKVISGKTGKPWNAEYDSKEDAEAGLKAYFANEAKLIKLTKVIKELKSKIPANILAEREAKRHMKTLNEYIGVEEDYGEGDYVDPYVAEEDMNGDARLNQEITKMGGGELPNTKKFIDNIRKSTLSAMTQLSDESQSEEFQTLKAIFDQCSKYDAAQKAKMETETVQESVKKEIKKPETKPAPVLNENNEMAKYLEKFNKCWNYKYYSPPK